MQTSSAADDPRVAGSMRVFVLRINRVTSSAVAAVDRHLLSAGRSAANPPHAAAAVDRRERQTDGRTDK